MGGKRNISIYSVLSRSPSAIFQLDQYHNVSILDFIGAEYLGLNLHKQLSWNFHTDATAKKANKIRSFIARNVHSCPKKVKAVCYTTLVRPAMLPLLGPLILHRIVINWNRSSDVLLGLHVTGMRESQRDRYVERLEVGDIGD